jgi:hypothetical protein
MIIANFIVFQIGWFACVLAGAHDRPWLGAGAALAIVAVHVARAERPGNEAVLVLLAGVIGLVFDSALVAAGWVRYASGAVVAGFAPQWIVALWLLFATTLNVSLRWLRRMPLVSALLGGIGGPLAYWGGARLDAMQFVAPIGATAVLAVGWAVITPILVRLGQRFDGYPSVSGTGATGSSPRAFGETR